MMYGRPPHPGPPKQWCVYIIQHALLPSEEMWLVWSIWTFQELIEIATFALPVAIFYVYTVDIYNWSTLAPFEIDINYRCVWHKDDSKVKILSCKMVEEACQFPVSYCWYDKLFKKLKTILPVNLLRSVCNNWTPEKVIAFWLRFPDF